MQDNKQYKSLSEQLLWSRSSILAYHPGEQQQQDLLLRLELDFVRGPLRGHRGSPLALLLFPSCRKGQKLPCILYHRKVNEYEHQIDQVATLYAYLPALSL